MKDKSFTVSPIELFNDLKFIFVDSWVTKLIFAPLVFVADWIFGKDVETLLIVVLIILFDTVTGFAKAWKKSAISSKAWKRPPIKVSLYFGLLAFGYIVDKALPLPVAAAMIKSCLIIRESISVLENFGELGAQIPRGLLNKLKVMNDILNDEVAKDAVIPENK